MPRYIKPVRLMIREAVEALSGTATCKEIINYIREKYGDVNEGTIRCQITICTVNHPSRVHYPENQKPRICLDERYDFLYRIAPCTVTLYDPEKHGLWAIVKEEGKLKVKKLSEHTTEKHLKAPPKPSFFKRTIGSRDLIDRFVKVCIKLDELRFAGTIDWNGLATNIFHNLKLSNSDKVLLFWLCSIIDQFYPYERIWTVGERAMLKLLEEVTDPKDLEHVVINGRVIKLNGEQFILVRDDLERIQKTYTFLSSYSEVDGSPSIKLVHFLGQLIGKLHGKGGVVKLAYYINRHLWHGKPYTQVSFYVDRRELKKFLEQSRKRLWMFLMFLRRDPSIQQILRNALIEVYGSSKGAQLYELWINEEKFSTKELELPSDMWNQRLFNALIGRVVPGKLRDAKKIARKLAEKYDISPTVFDVTFEVGANKCKQGECVNCSFGDNQLCQKERREGEICPLTEWLYPYYRKDPSTPQLKCKPQQCPIGQNLGANLCTRIINRTFKH